MGQEITKLDTNLPPFVWSSAKEQASLELATGDLTLNQIAENAGVSRQALFEWRNHPTFLERVETSRAEICTAIRSQGIAVLEHRVRALNTRWRKMLEVIEARAIDPQFADVPGGKTGLLVHNVKGIGQTIIDTYEVDTALLRELREHEKQAAQELGQWTEKRDITSGGQPLQPIVIVEVNPLPRRVIEDIEV